MCQDGACGGVQPNGALCGDNDDCGIGVVPYNPAFCRDTGHLRACSQHCQNDDDCTLGGSCVGGFCLATCQGASECEPGFSCDLVVTMSGQSTQACVSACFFSADFDDCHRCRDNSTCPPGFVCDLGTCLPGCTSATGCWKYQASRCDTATGRCGACQQDSDCDQFDHSVHNGTGGWSGSGDPSEMLDYACVAGQCVQCRDDASCPDGFACRDSVCTLPCWSDQSCYSFSKAVCDLSSGECVPCSQDADCAHFDPGTSNPALYCLAGQCVRCRTDADCGANATCAAAGVCVLTIQIGAACESSPSAYGSEGCKAGVCLAEFWGFADGYCTKGCASDAACPAGSHCDAAYAACVASCATADDCRQGYQCADLFFGQADGRSECVPQ
jgi:hypothetical protein